LTGVKYDGETCGENVGTRAMRASGDTMTLTTFQDLLDAAHGQPEPQRLLFVFARVDLPESPTAAQRERYERREGGTLSPCLCVDKAPSELASFQALAEESAVTGQSWDIVFVASLSGHAGVAPGADEATQPLRLMVNAINNGRVTEFAAFDRGGDALQFS
jgi:hypothetical protein